MIGRLEEKNNIKMKLILYCIAFSVTYFYLSGQLNFKKSTPTDVPIESRLDSIDCSYNNLPSNVIWSEVFSHYENCINYTTRRSDAKSMFEFLSFIKHSDSSNTTLSTREVRIIKSYYRFLKRCSNCEAIDCYSCDELMSILDQSNDLVREKRFKLE